MKAKEDKIKHKEERKESKAKEGRKEKTIKLKIAELGFAGRAPGLFPAT